MMERLPFQMNIEVAKADARWILQYQPTSKDQAYKQMAAECIFVVSIMFAPWCVSVCGHPGNSLGAICMHGEIQIKSWQRNVLHI